MYASLGWIQGFIYNGHNFLVYYTFSSSLGTGILEASDSEKFLITIMIHHLIAGDCYYIFSSFLCGGQG